MRTSRRSERGAGLAAAIAVAALTALVVVGAFELRRRATPAATGDAALLAQLERVNREIEGLAKKLAQVEAEQRTLASLATLRDRPAAAAGRASVRPMPSVANDLAAKPLERLDLPEERASRVDDAAIVRALEQAAAVRDLSAEPWVPEPAPQPDVAPTSAEDSAETTEGEKAHQAADEAVRDSVVVAFNQLLADSGLTNWKLLNAELIPDERALGKVVLAQRGERGTAIGSLSAERLVLERDPITGVAGIEMRGAKGVEGGVEVAFENGTTRFEIPGILPLELLAPCLRDVFGLEHAPPDEASRTGDEVARAINHVLTREKNVALRVRSVDRLEERTLKSAVIDLAFDSQGAPTQTVVADQAWFELDATARHAELCCEGGEMIEDGTRRPLFRGKLRLQLREIEPANWKGMPAARVAGGS